MKKKIFYYEDERNDDFAQTVKKINPLPQKYRYVSKNPFVKLLSFILYRLIIRPIVWVYVKVKFHHKFVGKKALCREKSGCFVYGNHVTLAGDAFIPNLISVRKRNYIVTGKETNSLTGLLPFLKAMGNIPLGQDRKTTCAMLRCMRQRIKEGASITIYPEAHIWPYYTGIRPFDEASFHYAAIMNAPVFAMTKCFQKKRFGSTPRIVTFIDGPFYPQEGMTRAENAKYLRDKVYEIMCARAAEHSTYAAYEYRKKETEHGNDGAEGVPGNDGERGNADAV